MKLDVNRILDLQYLNDLVSQINGEIEENRNKFVKTYDLDTLVAIGVEDVKLLFSQYEVGNSGVLEYILSDFIDSDWEYADLFKDDILHANELKEEYKAKAIDELKELNDKITLLNKNYQKNIDDLEELLKLLISVISLIERDNIVLDKEVTYLKNLIINSRLSDIDKLKFSFNIVKYLIEKNKALDLKNVDVIDTTEFEKALDEVYSSSLHEPDLDDEFIEEPVYSETIISSYNYYKHLFDSEGLGDDITEALNIAYDMYGNSDIDICDSMSKEDFCIKMGYLLYLLNDYQKQNENTSDILSDLGRLDRLYEEDSQHAEYKLSLLTDVDTDLKLISELDVKSVIVSKIRNRLKLLKSELSYKLINTKRKNLLISEYKDIELEMRKIPELRKQTLELSKLKNEILRLISSLGLSADSYMSLNKVQEEVFKLIEFVEDTGLIENFDEVLVRLYDEVNKYKTVSSEKEKVNINGFVLFDFDENGKTYVVDDLDPNSRDNLIDKVILKDKLIVGYNDYNTLINDLFVYGVPQIELSATPPPKITRRVDKGGVPTEMKRIRPTEGSLVRFVEQRFTLVPNTEIHSQVLSIITSILPNVNISSSDKFVIYINYASALKKASDDVYDKAIKRFDRESPLHKLFMSFSDKVKFSDDECELLKDFIHMSLEAYSDLEKKNSYLHFNVVEQMGGKKTRG